MSKLWNKKQQLGMQHRVVGSAVLHRKGVAQVANVIPCDSDSMRILLILEKSKNSSLLNRWVAIEGKDIA